MLSETAQLTLSDEALRLAAGMIAGQAEVLAEEIEDGVIADRGGADALRLLAVIVRTMSADAAGAVVGTA